MGEFLLYNEHGSSEPAVRFALGTPDDDPIVGH
jgi:hypothetical protein